ncbi:hypothetical protein GCG21_13725 [Pseudactinotalea sp. HY160]|uniref:hypothetical protein n=1 Tax=Pseudactinotalea sp. HY160 TaxID=2654490 RepID=UPI00128DC362|nr:hypothetical protein [Pseudactinotalea sp. HY160]MPV51046.1 hypothetical protein [Pseudactinotalea sp. HY160]
MTAGRRNPPPSGGGGSQYTDSQIGRNFWLTRNHHGAGSWARGLGEDDNELTRAAQSYGELDLISGEDGMLHFE